MNTFKKYGLFTFIYILLTWTFSNDLNCLLDVDMICLTNFLGKYVVFIVLMIVYDRWIKGGLFGKKNKKNNEYTRRSKSSR